MIIVRKTLLIYFAIWCVSIAVAAVSALWLGADTRIPVDMLADGTVTKSVGGAVLWFLPAIHTVLYGTLLIAALAEAWRWRKWPPATPLGDDAKRSLARYGRTIRNYMIAFGVLGILMQLFMLARALGVVTPLGLDREGMVRIFFFCAGLLFAYAGNATPKLPYVRTRTIDAARQLRANRFVGWVFMAGGLAYSLTALVAPFDRLSQYGGMLIGAMLLLPVIRYVWAVIDYRREQRWLKHEGLI
jgi:hypothetical protein